MTMIQLIACIGMIAGFLWCWGSPRRNERQHLLPVDCRPPAASGRISTRRPLKKAGFFRREITEAPGGADPYPGVRGSFPWCAWPPGAVCPGAPGHRHSCRKRLPLSLCWLSDLRWRRSGMSG